MKIKIIKQSRTNSKKGKIFDIFNYTFLAGYAFLSVVPLLYVLAASFAPDSEIRTRAFFLIPHTISLDAYKYVLGSSTLMRSILVSLGVTVFGTIINLFLTLTMAYPLSRKDFWGRNLFLNLIIFTMVFNGGLIPTYLTVKSLGLLDSYAALVLPTAISVWSLIIVKNFYEQLPPSLEEAARIDGCTDLQVLGRIVLPLSKPIIATFGLFYAVGHWNNFYNSLLYINDSHKWPLQVMLRQIVMLSQSMSSDMTSVDPDFVMPQESIKMAVIIVAMVPIMLVYPFLQKHFAKGVLIGSVKG